MRKVSAVIGAGYGDEGKGLVTDYLTTPSSLVVRFNGGAQAGHTVVTPEGKRHVFHHFGSGTLRGAPTYLSEFFVLHPMFFSMEWEHIAQKHSPPTVFYHPRCLVTTPYDVMLNQAAEKKRGTARHGSCGLGFHETMRRSAVLPMTSLSMTDRSSLRIIRDEYVPQRMEELGLSIEDMPYLKSDAIFDRFLRDVDFFKVNARKKADLSSKDGDIIFEGAQGLQLDMNSPNYPYVTHSNTGMTNVLALVRQSNNTDTIDVYYVTRCYLTRHGAGPMPHEYGKYDRIDDTTNVHNDHQGHLRYSYLDIDVLLTAITKDVKPNTRNHLVVTCLDQVDSIRCVKDGKVLYFFKYEFRKYLEQLGMFHSVFMSHGPTRDTLNQDTPHPSTPSSQPPLSASPH